MSTLATALVIAAVILWRRRSPLTAVIAVMAWASAYEVGFAALGTVLHGWPPGALAWLAAALAGWIVLAQVWGVVPDRLLLAATALLTLAWIGAGFHANSVGPSATGGTRAFSAVDEILNEGTKTLLGAAYLVGGLRRRSRP